MNCKLCGNRAIGNLCVDCSIDSRLPSRIHDAYWIYIESSVPIDSAKSGCDAALFRAITTKKSTISPDGKTIELKVEGETLSITAAAQELDELAEKSGVLIGKWLIFRDRSKIDKAWKTIARNTFRGKLGVSAKASTAISQRNRHVICVYTKSFLDLQDVMRVRGELKELGFVERLCYKPDLYTYLGIYNGTTSLSPCRYQD